MDQNIQKLREVLTKNQISRDSQDIKLISSCISHVKIFDLFRETKSIFRELCMYLTYEFYNPNQYVFKAGDYGDKFYILLKGQAGVIIRKKDKDSYIDQEVFVYKDGGSFGELALTEKKPRAASILTKSECHFAVIDKSNYNRIMGSVLKKKRNDLIEFLQKQALFQQWTKGSLLKLSYCFEEKYYKKGNIIFNEGQKIESIYLIKEGEVKISRNLKIDLIDSNEPLTKKTFFLKKVYRHNADISLLGIGELIGYYDLEKGFYSGTCKCNSTNLLLLAISPHDFKKRINTEDSLNFLKNGKEMKHSIHEESIKSITKIVKERVNSPYKKIFLEENGINTSPDQPNSLLHKLKTINLTTSFRENGQVGESFIKKRATFNETGNSDLDFSYTQLGLSFEHVISKRQTLPIEENQSTQRVGTSLQNKRTEYASNRPKSCNANNQKILNNMLKTENVSFPRNSSQKKRNDKETLNNSINLSKKETKKINLLITQIEPFGRTRTKSKNESKDDEIINIHAEKKRRLLKNRNPSNWSFRAIRISPKRFHSIK